MQKCGRANTVRVCFFAHLNCMNCLNAWNRSVRLENLAYVFEILVKFSICYQFRYTFTYVAICCFQLTTIVKFNFKSNFCEDKNSMSGCVVSPSRCCYLNNYFSNIFVGLHLPVSKLYLIHGKD